MATRATTPEDHAYFEFLAPLRWPDKSPETIEEFRQLMISGDLQIESVLENALVVQSKGLYTRAAGIEDFSGTWGDAKKSVTQWRNNDISRGRWTNSAPVCKINSKSYMLRIMCYSKISQQFFFFAIPNKFYQGIEKVEIVFDQFTNTYDEPTPLGLLKDNHKWNDFVVADFTELATVTEEQMSNKVYRIEYDRFKAGEKLKHSDASRHVVLEVDRRVKLRNQERRAMLVDY